MSAFWPSLEGAEREEWEDQHGRVLRVRPSEVYEGAAHVTTDWGDWLVRTCAETEALLTTELCGVCLHGLDAPCACDEEETG